MNRKSRSKGLKFEDTGGQATQNVGGAHAEQGRRIHAASLTFTAAPS